MSERFKKKLIAILLFMSCLISGWLLFISPSSNSKQLQNVARVDSLLYRTFSDFNISNAQISTSSVEVDSVFTRKKYRVSVPAAFSKTQLHAALQQQFLPYGIDLPARVTFPEKNMDIQFYFKGSVIRTVTLTTDKKLIMQRSFANIIVAFNEEPPAYMMEILSSFGEPIPVAVILRTPLNIPNWWDDFIDEYSTPYIWPQTASGNNLLTRDRQQITSALEVLEESAPNATLLHFFEDAQVSSTPLTQTPFSYINARDAFILDAEVGRTGFNQTFRAFIRQSRGGSVPLAIIKATEESLEWTRQELNTFKKGGLTLTLPRKTNFRP